MLATLGVLLLAAVGEVPAGAGPAVEPGHVIVSTIRLHQSPGRVCLRVGMEEEDPVDLGDDLAGLEGPVDLQGKAASSLDGFRWGRHVCPASAGGRPRR